MSGNDVELDFPDAPRAALDETIEQLVGRARDVLATQGRLRALLRANRGVIEQLELPALLRQIVAAAVDLVGAEYGALGVIAPEGGLEQFIHVGLTPERAKRIGELPRGRGLLGALIDDPRPIVLEHLATDARSAGFPPNHPEMDSFLGVPIRVGNEVFGNLYLTNQSSGRFSNDDAELVVSLAATAGAAINNARLYQATRRRQERTSMAADLVTEILSGRSSDPLRLVAARMQQLTRAWRVHLLTPTNSPDAFTVARLQGDDAVPAEGERFNVSGSPLEQVAATGRPELMDGDVRDLRSLTVRSSAGGVMCVAVRAGEQLEALLVVEREPGPERFKALDLELASDLARQSALAVQLAGARAQQQRMELFEERARIARDLHDLVIQQIFSAGLGLQALAGALSDPAQSAQVESTVEQLDSAISQIRTIIFALTVPADSQQPSVRHRLMDVAGEVGVSMKKTASLSFSGPIDVLVRGSLADDVVAVVREALTNIARHAKAEEVSVFVGAEDGTVLIEVIDNGVGVGPSTRRSGLANLGQRAAERGGEFELESDDNGTRIRWSVPVS